MCLAVAIFFAGQHPLPAGAPALASTIGKAIIKYFARQGGGEASEYLAKKGVKELVERVAANATREGGEEAVEQVARMTAKFGPETLSALDNVPSILPVIKALDSIPESQVASALAKLAAGPPGRELGEAVVKYGAKAITSELKHPGVGLVLVRTLGDDGAALASQLSTDGAIAVARHAEDLGKLPPSQRQGVLGLLRENTDRFLVFVGRFVEANPGKTLFTVATTTVILAQPDRILGGDEIAFDADGNPILISKPGLIGRTTDVGSEIAQHVSTNYVRPVFLTALTFVTAFAVLYAAMKFWHLHRVNQAKLKAIEESGD